MSRKLLVSLLIAAVLAAAAILAAPAGLRAYWSVRDANPVRRGVARARELGCLTCHGPGGLEGIPDPGLPEGGVPSWGGGVWMMYVENDEEIREFILDGVSRARAGSVSAQAEREKAAVQMPAYRDVLGGSDLDDLVAAFQVLSGMSRPEKGTAADRGYRLARTWHCFSCHGPGASGGVPNPGSLAGFIPGWYGPAFEDLVRDRSEFDAWVRDGWIDRLARSRVAAHFADRQRIKMPWYPDFSDGDLDDLWAYTVWLGEHGGVD
ncbi:MAG: c-type cytochrome [Acidobacteriota bacterium]|jgi:hypothetical protein